MANEIWEPTDKKIIFIVSLWRWLLRKALHWFLEFSYCSTCGFVVSLPPKIPEFSEKCNERETGERFTNFWNSFDRLRLLEEDEEIRILYQKCSLLFPRALFLTGRTKMIQTSLRALNGREAQIKPMGAIFDLRHYAHFPRKERPFMVTPVSRVTIRASLLFRALATPTLAAAPPLLVSAVTLTNHLPSCSRISSCSFLPLSQTTATVRPLQCLLFLLVLLCHQHDWYLLNWCLLQ